MNIWATPPASLSHHSRCGCLASFLTVFSGGWQKRIYNETFPLDLLDYSDIIFNLCATMWKKCRRADFHRWCMVMLFDILDYPYSSIFTHSSCMIIIVCSFHQQIANICHPTSSAGSLLSNLFGGLDSGSSKWRNGKVPGDACYSWKTADWFADLWLYHVCFKWDPSHHENPCI